MRKTTSLLAGLLLTSGLLCAGEVERRLKAAADVLNEVMDTPDKGIPQDLLDKSACVVIIPSLKMGGLIILGGKGGKGFMSCRRDGGVGWSAPAAVRVEGGSVGPQIGFSEVDLIMLVMNKGGAEKLLTSKFTLGADATVAAGPVGRSTAANTDAKFQAEILTYSRSRGAFAGLALQGSTLRPDKDWNSDMYGKEIPSRDIVFGDTTAPTGAEPLLVALNKYSSRK